MHLCELFVCLFVCLFVMFVMAQVSLVGGGDTRQAQAGLREGCEVVVATPGVLQEFVRVLSGCWHCLFPCFPVVLVD